MATVAGKIVAITILASASWLTGYLIGVHEVSTLKAVEAEHKTHFKSGPPNPEWVTGNEKEK